MAKPAGSSSSRMVRLSDKAFAAISSLASQTGLSKQALVERAIENLRRDQMAADTVAAYEAMRREVPEASDFEREMALWDRTLPDGLDDACKG